MILYLYNEFDSKTNTKSELSEVLVHRAFNEYIIDNQIEIQENWDLEIKRSALGKPTFKNAPFHFSVSHTGKQFACLINDRNVGVDIEKKLPKNIYAVSKRIFSSEECKQVDLRGKEAFREIWVRKEAVVKFMGASIFDVNDQYSVADANGLLNKIEIDGQMIYIYEVDIDMEIQCAYACSDDNNVEVRVLI